MSPPGPRRGRPPENSAQDTRQRILDEATRLFARNGFHGTSVSEIGKAAGVQSGALYYHIKSKDELLWEILSSYVSDMRESNQAVFDAHDDPVERMRAMLHNHVTQIARFRRHVTIELRDRTALSKPHADELQKMRDEIQQLWQRALDDGAAAGVFRTSDRVITNATLTMVNLVSQWYRQRRSHSIDDVAGILTDFVMAGILAEPGSASGSKSRRKP